MKFPNWAPKSLCDYYDNVSDYSPKEENELLERLLTDEDMIPVWRAYREISSQGPDLAATSHLFFSHIMCAYKASDEKRLPTSESIEKLDEIAKKAEKLAHVIKNTEFDTDVLLYLSDPQFFDREDKTEPGDKEKLSKLRRTVHITVGTLLKRIVKLTEARSKAIKQDKHIQYIQNPRSQHAQANYFIRAMSEIFEGYFGAAQPRLLARLTRVALNDPTIDETTVKTSLKEWKKASEKHLKTLIDKP